VAVQRLPSGCNATCHVIDGFTAAVSIITSSTSAAGFVAAAVDSLKPDSAITCTQVGNGLHRKQ
jgi:hypothetical protein